MVKQVTINWIVPESAANIVSVLNYDDAVASQSAVDAANDFIDSIASNLVSGVAWNFDSVVTLKDTVTGTTTGIESITPPPTGSGSAAGGQVPNASMFLVQFRTGVYSRGREVRGRWFIPGGSANAVFAGEVAGANLTAMNDALATWLGGLYAPVVWSRIGGIAPPVSSGSVWSELAVIRGRRA